MSNKYFKNKYNSFLQRLKIDYKAVNVMSNSQALYYSHKTGSQIAFHKA